MATCNIIDVTTYQLYGWMSNVSQSAVIETTVWFSAKFLCNKLSLQFIYRSIYWLFLWVCVSSLQGRPMDVMASQITVNSTRQRKHKSTASLALSCDGNHRWLVVSSHKGPVIRTVYPKKYAHGFCFAVLCCGYTLTDFPISIRLTLLALWQSNDCPSASKATLMNMDKYFMWIHYERLHNHNKAKAQQNRVHISWDIL